VPSFLLPPQLLSPFPNRIPSPPRFPTPLLIKPDSSYSVLISRIFPDSSPQSICSFSSPSYSLVHSPEEPPRPTSPASSTTSSVEFIDEVTIPLPRPRHYCYYDPHQFLDTLIPQFPKRTTPLPHGSYSIRPDDFDLGRIRSIVSGQDPSAIIPVFLSHSRFPYEIPVLFFHNLFSPSKAIIREID